MVTEVTVGSSGGNRTPWQITVGDSGTNRDIKEINVGSPGGNRKVFERDDVGQDWDTAALSITAASNVGSVTVDINIQSDGTYEEDRNGLIVHKDWSLKAPSTTGSRFEVSWAQVSGDTPTTTPGAASTWLDLGTDRRWAMTDSSPLASTKSGIIDITIRWDGDSAGEVTKRVTLTADYDTTP